MATCLCFSLEMCAFISYFLCFLVANGCQISFETNAVALHFNIYSAFFLFLEDLEQLRVSRSSSTVLFKWIVCLIQIFLVGDGYDFIGHKQWGCVSLIPHYIKI